jgi:cbb3-type cytochrome oxidase subunit 3
MNEILIILAYILITICFCTGMYFLLKTEKHEENDIGI